MRKTPFEIFKEIFVVLLVAAAIPILLGFFLGLMELSWASLFVPREILDPAAVDPSTMGPLSFLPALNMSALGIGAFVAQIFLFLASTLLSAGASLSIYRKLKYDTNIQVEDLFYFFRHRPGFALIVFILAGLLTLIGFILLIIPGIILSIGFYTLPVVIALSEDKGFSPVQVLKETWATTKGHKGTIFGKLLIYGLVMAVISGAVSFFLNNALGESLLDPNSVQATVISPLISSVMAFITTLVMFIPEIDIYQDLIGNRVFDRDQNLDDNIEEDLEFPETKDQ